MARVDFSLNGYRVWRPIFRRRLRICDTASGRVWISTAAQTAQLASVLAEIELARRPLDPIGLIYGHVMLRWIGAVLEPQSFPATMFMTTAPGQLAQNMLRAVRAGQAASINAEVDAIEAQTARLRDWMHRNGGSLPPS